MTFLLLAHSSPWSLVKTLLRICMRGFNDGFLNCPDLFDRISFTISGSHITTLGIGPAHRRHIFPAIIVKIMKQEDYRAFLLSFIASSKLTICTIFLNRLIGEWYDTWHNPMIELIHGMGPCFLEPLDLFFHVPIEDFVRVSSDSLFP